MPSTRAPTAPDVSVTMKPVGKPDAGNPHVRLDERGGETGLCYSAGTAPLLDSTNQRQEAAYPRRYARSPDARHRAWRRRPGSRRRRPADGDAVWRLSVPAQALRGWRLSRAGVSGGDEARNGASQRRNRQAFGPRKRVRRPAQALARRENFRLAQPLSPIGQRLGVSRSEGPRVSATRFDPVDAAKAMHPNIMFADRL